MPTLSICMIAKNEEKWIAQALDSVRGLADEIIVVDSHSADRTVEIAMSRGAKVFQVDWTGDFSHLRNESLKFAKGDWALVIDSDESISVSDHEHIHALTERNDHAAYTLVQRNYTNSMNERGFFPSDSYPESKRYKGFCPNPIVRLFMRKPEIYYEQPIHETVTSSILRSGGTIGESNIPIHHYGLFRENSPQKLQRLLPIALDKIKESPKNPVGYAETARLYFGLGNYQEAEKYFLLALAIDPRFPELYSYLMELYEKTGQRERLIVTFQAAQKYSPSDPQVYISLGASFVARRKFEDALAAYRKALTLNDRIIVAHLGAGICLHELGMEQEARKELLIVKKVDSTHPVVKKILGLK